MKDRGQLIKIQLINLSGEKYDLTGETETVPQVLYRIDWRGSVATSYYNEWDIENGLIKSIT